jgi:hypothetical protein
MAKAHVWGKPEVPPEPEDLGGIVTRFDGWVESNGSTAKGYHRFTIGVEASEKYKAMLMADKPGLRLHFEVYLKVSTPDGNDGGKLLAQLLGTGEDHMDDAIDLTDWNDLDG